MYWGVDMSAIYIIISIFLMCLVTFAVRALPFFCIELFTGHPFVEFLAERLPAAIMLILVLYSLSDIDVSRYPYGFAEVASVACITIVHIVKRNTVLSIACGLVLYGILHCTLGGKM